NDLIDKMDMPEQLKEVIKEKSQAAGDAFSATTGAASEKLVTGIYDRITDLIVSAIAYLFTFAVVGVIVLIAGILLDIVSKLPGIKQANAILGVIVGFVQGYLAVSVVYIAAVAFAATELGASVISQVAESEILTWFYNHNIVVDIVFGMLK
ncbi:MAG: CvpA family protein, partial [Ruminococcus bromii]|nr:CvpA family protein [Ruminococcus bromii]